MTPANSPEPVIDPQNRLAALGLIAFGFAFVLAALILLLLIPRPEKFYLDDPSNPEEVRSLIDSINQNLADLETESRADSGSDANSAEDYWPRDRNTIVRAIQQFRLDQNRIPANFKELLTSGVLAPDAISDASRFEIVHKPNRWDLVVDESKRIAVGN